MSVMIQIRNVPESLHRKLKVRAAMEGLSLSDFLLREARRAADQPTLSELKERLRTRPAARVTVPPADMVRTERDAR
jgi:plasmid stability protein